jgi:3-deoxy-D-manno-octulosonate 8-phosphate phosphatase (KDO 8-P phosphatase)
VLPNIRLAVFDVDGVMTDGRLYLLPDGHEMKVFHSRDGLGLKRLLQAGIEVAIISGRSAAVVEERAAALGIKHVYQGHENKLPVFNEILTSTGIMASEAAYTGDDLPDLAVMAAAGLGIAVADAQPEVRAGADFVTRCGGGQGAVREVCDLLLAAREAPAS